jgi:alpha-methylacyl-CoA racemase
MHAHDSLDGVHVVTMAQNVPGPLAAARLRQAGARVTKVEPPTGDPLIALAPTWHAELHAGIAIERLDLKATDGRARLDALLADADLFLTSHRPSALARLTLDPESLRARAPRLRLLRIVGSVRDPELPGHDLTYQAEAGLLGDGMPRTVLADVMASERAHAAALVLLRGPAGAVADVGIVESLAPLVAPLRHGLTAAHGPLGGSRPGYRTYAAREGRVAVAALEAHFERALWAQLELPPGADATATFAERTAAEWEAWAMARALPIAAVRE